MHFVEQACHENGLTSKQLAPDALAALSSYAWPGNVRELRNVIERMVILSDGDLALADVPAEIRGSAEPALDDGGPPLLELGEANLPAGLSLRDFREAVERAFIVKRLRDLSWNVSKTAESLGIERTHLHKKMKLLGIQRGA